VYAARSNFFTKNGRNLKDEDGIVKALRARGRCFGAWRMRTGYATLGLSTKREMST
jgi:hypothetical protein